MAISTCSKCGEHSFELAPFTPVGDSRKLMMVQCAGCGVAVGAFDPATPAQYEALKAQVSAIDQKLARIAGALRKSVEAAFRPARRPNIAQTWVTSLSAERRDCSLVTMFADHVLAEPNGLPASDPNLTW